MVNKKRVARLWRQEGLRVPKRTHKRRRGMSVLGPGEMLRASHPNQLWAIDFQFDATMDGRQLKFLNVVDEFTRESLAMEVGRSCTADDTIQVLDRIAGKRGAPEMIRCDNGPELIAHALRDWCRFNTTATVYIEPGCPWENPFVESFNSRVRDEFLNITAFYNLLEAKVFTQDWRNEYNHDRPHSSLGQLAPAIFAERWKAENQPEMTTRLS
jgi:putative transposase